MPQIDEETALIAVSFESDLKLAETFRAIMKYNRYHDDIILVFYEPFLHRFRAMQKLQRWAKGIMYRKGQKPIFEKEGRIRLRKDFFQEKEITERNTLYGHYVVINRISKKIQDAFRSWKMRLRVNSLINIAKYACAIDSNVLFLE